MRNKNCNDAFKILKELSIELKEVQKEFLLTSFAELITILYDRIANNKDFFKDEWLAFLFTAYDAGTLHGKESDSDALDASIFQYIYTAIEGALERYNYDIMINLCTSLRMIDIKCSVSVMPYKKNVYLMFFDNNQGTFVEHFKKIKEIEPYYYFNNTDRPYDIDEEDWEERKNVWDNVNVPAFDCFVFNLTNEQDIRFFIIDNKEEIINRIKSPEDRFKEKKEILEHSKRLSIKMCLDGDSEFNYEKAFKTLESKRFDVIDEDCIFNKKIKDILP